MLVHNIQFIFQYARYEHKSNIYIYIYIYFANIYIIITATCFDTFVSSSENTKVTHRKG
jgi:hypothetical protein